MSAPIPMPYSTRPRGVVAAVTGSVAMKNAHSIVAPPARWNNGDSNCAGSASHATVASAARLPSTAAGIGQRITRCHSNHSPPASTASDSHSQPPVMTATSFARSSGVAAVTPSNGRGQRVISTGNEISSTT